MDLIMLDSVRVIREMCDDLTRDVMYYTSSVYKYAILDAVAQLLNAKYREYREAYPKFTGKVSLFCHALGSVIAFDLVWNQPQAKHAAAGGAGAGAQGRGGRGQRRQARRERRMACGQMAACAIRQRDPLKRGAGWLPGAPPIAITRAACKGGQGVPHPRRTQRQGPRARQRERQGGLVLVRRRQRV